MSRFYLRNGGNYDRIEELIKPTRVYKYIESKHIRKVEQS